MKDMKTIVYFDLEATGLKISGKHKISELSLVAVNIKDMLDYHLKISALKKGQCDRKDRPNRKIGIKGS